MRGGKNTKIHAIVANEKFPIALMLSEGHLNDGPQGRILLRQLDDRFKNSKILMDKAYEGNQTRSLVRSLGMVPVVPPKLNRKNPWKYDKTLYKRRNEVERFFRRLKEFRRISTRYDKLDIIYLSFVLLAISYELIRCFM